MAGNPNILDRIVAKSQPDINTGCWVWSGFTDRDGYGTIKVSGISRRAHRVAYEVWHGPIAENLVVRHRCDNASCVNPNHLLVGTHAENVQDMDARGRRTIQLGPKNNGVKVSVDQVIAAFTDRRATSVVARDLGMTRENVGMIRRRRSWRSVTDHLPQPEYQKGSRWSA
jgi:hypothetical protein